MEDTDSYVYPMIYITISVILHTYTHVRTHAGVWHMLEGEFDVYGILWWKSRSENCYMECWKMWSMMLIIVLDDPLVTAWQDLCFFHIHAGMWQSVRLMEENFSIILCCQKGIQQKIHFYFGLQEVLVAPVSLDLPMRLVSYVETFSCP